MKSLHLSFQRVVDNEMFNGIKLSSSLSISHLFYADDAVFMGQWCDGNISTLIHVLECFYWASGLRINMSKSKILGVNVDSDKVKGAASKLGLWKWGLGRAREIFSVAWLGKIMMINCFSDVDSENLGHRFPLMKTKRKLVPKSTAATNSAGSGECNVVGQDGYDNVGGNVSPGSQRLRQLSSVPCHDQGLQVSGLPDVGLSVPPKGRCVHHSASASCGDQRLPTSGMPHAISRPSFSHSTDGDNVHTHSAGSGENYHQAAHGVDTDS
ncbi:hypothetical protein Tco_0666937 [Tanacetum coccineum]